MDWWQLLIIIVAVVIVLFLLTIFLYRVFFKRFWDFFLSFLAINLLLPLLLLLSLTGLIAMKGNPFFVQPRPGKNERVFHLIKFRTMSNKKDLDGKLLPDKDRLNKYGKFLRATSLDELPELLNILIGDMSIVGPRPLLVKYLPFYPPKHKLRHNVRPGLTGYSQCHGRNSLSWDDKLDMDVFYVKNISVFLDIKIILMTVICVFQRMGINGKDSATMNGYVDYLNNKNAILNNFVPSLKNLSLGKTYLIFLGQAGFIIRNKNGQSLVIDPYLTDCVERVENDPAGFKRLQPIILKPTDYTFNIVVCTHFHRDHFDIDAMPGLTSEEKTLLVCPFDCENDIKNLEIKNYKIIKPGDCLSQNGFELHFVNCDHGGSAPYAVGVVVKVDGFTILETGDTCLRLDRKNEYLSFGDVDVFIAPINGHFGNLNEKEFCSLAKTLKPHLCVPCHYGMFEKHGGDLGLFYDKIKKTNLNYKIMNQGEIFELKE